MAQYNRTVIKIYKAAKEDNNGKCKKLISNSRLNADAAFDLALDKGNRKACECLIDLRANINQKNNQGCTALHAAAERCSIKLVEYLVSQGADMEVPDSEGSIALHKAAMCGHQKVVEF